MTYNGNCDGFLLIYSILNYLSYYVSARECKAQLGFKKSGFSGQYPTRPETRSLGAGQGGLGFLGFKFFRGRDPRGVKN